MPTINTSPFGKRVADGRSPRSKSPMTTEAPRPLYSSRIVPFYCSGRMSRSILSSRDQDLACRETERSMLKPALLPRPGHHPCPPSPIRCRIIEFGTDERLVISLPSMPTDYNHLAIGQEGGGMPGPCMMEQPCGPPCSFPPSMWVEQFSRGADTCRSSSSHHQHFAIRQQGCCMVASGVTMLSVIRQRPERERLSLPF